MTKFVKENFDYHGGYLNYHLDAYPSAWDRRKFVARFKYVGGNKAGFQKFLIENFSIEEYFDRLDAGEGPLTILQSKGYIDAHVKKWLKEAGLPISQDSIGALIEKQKSAYEAMKIA